MSDTYINNAGLWQECIDLCWTARNECQKSLFTHCFEKGGKYLERNHVRIMMDCSEICRTTADSLTHRSPVYAAICAATAAICEACAESCDQLDTETMRQVGAHCRAAAKACHTLGIGGEGDETITLPPPVEKEFAAATASR